MIAPFPNGFVGSPTCRGRAVFPKKNAGVGLCRRRRGCGWQTRDRETLPSRTADRGRGSGASPVTSTPPSLQSSGPARSFAAFRSAGDALRQSRPLVTARAPARREPSAIKGDPAAHPPRWTPGGRRFVNAPALFLIRDDAHQPAQRFAAARQAGADRTDRYAENRSDLLVTHPFEADQQYDRTLLFRELGDRPFEVAQFQALALLRGAGQQRLALAEPDGRTLAHGPAHMVHILIVQDRE